MQQTNKKEKKDFDFYGHGSFDKEKNHFKKWRNSNSANYNKFRTAHSNV